MDTLIIGAGASGLMAACFCTGRTLVIDRLKQPGCKLLATGGGRCNLTHATDAAGIMRAFGRQASFMGPALRAFPPTDIRDFFRSWGVETCETSDGSVFPVSQKASDVLGALRQAAEANGADIRCGVRAQRFVVAADELSPEPNYRESLGRVIGVETSAGDLLRAQRVILAAGGQSYPNLGSDGSGFALARGVGLSVVPPVPALAGLVTQERWPTELTGIVVDLGGLRLDLKGFPKTYLTGPLLFTHKGISGPPALALSGDIAARLQAGNAIVPVRVSFRTDRTADDWRTLFEGWRRERGGRALHNLLAGELPRSLAGALCTVSGNRHGGGTGQKGKPRRSGHRLFGSAASYRRDRGMGSGYGDVRRRSAFELDANSLACKRLARLFCAGEVVDLDGPCGGYNLTWAFASGRLAGFLVRAPDLSTTVTADGLRDLSRLS
jgi:predicted Rossmann fold flavoprotein